MLPSVLQVASRDFLKGGSPGSRTPGLCELAAVRHRKPGDGTTAKRRARPITHMSPAVAARRSDASARAPPRHARRAAATRSRRRDPTNHEHRPGRRRRSRRRTGGHQTPRRPGAAPTTASRVSDSRPWYCLHGRSPPSRHPGIARRRWNARLRESQRGTKRS